MVAELKIILCESGFVVASPTKNDVSWCLSVRKGLQDLFGLLGTNVELIECLSGISVSGQKLDDSSSGMLEVSDIVKLSVYQNLVLV